MIKPILSAVVSVAGTHLSDDEKYLLNQYNPLGVTLFARNIETPDKIKILIQEIKDTLERDDVLIGIDQEGGRVARLKPPYFREYLSQRSIGALPEQELKKRASYLQATLIADELKSMGINLNYAPCADVLFENTGNVLKSRCFSSDEKEVSTLAKIMLNTYIEQGVIPCLKHAPGHGRATVDPHLDLPILDDDLVLLKKDFYPFKHLASIAPMMMTAHIVLTKIDDKPVTQSKKVIHQIIRGEIGFDGFLISDAIDMHALKGSLSEKVMVSLEAVCDAICYCMGDLAGLEEVLKSALPLSDKGMERFLKLKSILSDKEKSQKISQILVDEYQSIQKKSPVFSEDYDAVEILHRLKQK